MQLRRSTSDALLQEVVKDYMTALKQKAKMTADKKQKAKNVRWPFVVVRVLTICCS